jgi:hypothetical protein
MQTLASILSSTAIAVHNCRQSGNKEWQSIWEDVLANAEEELPHGSGFDFYPVVTDLNKVTDRHFTIFGRYHAMDENGYYDGWSDYTIHVWATFDGVAVTCVGGGKHNEYIRERFWEALNNKFEKDSFRKKVETVV